MKTILITGISGFLGSHIAKYLLKKKYQIIGLIRSKTDTSRIKSICNDILLFNIDDMHKLENLFHENNIDIIINCAVYYDRSDRNAVECLYSNIVMPITLLEIAYRNRISMFISFDSYYSYSNIQNMKHYITSKKQLKEWLKIFSQNMNIYNLILFHMYGDDDNKDKFIPFIIKSLLGEEESIDLTNCLQEKDFIFIDDVVELVSRIIEKEESSGYHQYAVGTGETKSLKEMIEILQKLAPDYSCKFKFGAIPNADETCYLSVDKDLLKKDFNWFPKYNLYSGLKKTVECYISNYENE